MSFLGDYSPTEDIYFRFTTRNFTTGVPATLAGSPVVSVYQNGSTTQVAVSGGAGSLTTDFDGVTGLNSVFLDISGAAVTGDLDFVLTAGTVGGVSVVGEVVGRARYRASNLTNGDLSDIQAELNTSLNVTTYAEPSAVPAATSSIASKIGFLFAMARNKRTQTATTQLLRNDADAATIGTSTVSDDGTTFTRGKFT